MLTITTRSAVCNSIWSDFAMLILNMACHIGFYTIILYSRVVVNTT